MSPLRMLPKFRISEASAVPLRETGFSLVELMVVTGCLSILGLGAMKILDVMFKGQTDVRLKVSVQEIAEDIHRILESADNCELNFANLSLNSPSTVQDLREHVKDFQTGAILGQRVVYAHDELFENESLRFKPMTLGDFTTVNEVNGVATLVLTLNRTRARGVPPDVYRKIYLNVTLDNLTDKKVVTCHASGFGGSFSANACEELGGRFEPGASAMDNRCIFPQFFATTDPNLVPDPATPMLQVRGDSNSDGVFEDMFAILPDGRTAIDYSLDGAGSQSPLPGADPNTKLYVDGDVRVSNNMFSGEIRANQIILAQPSDWTDPLLLDSSSAGQLPQLMARESTNPGYAGLGARNGTLFFNGGNDDHTNFGNSSTNGAGGFEFNWNPDKAASPFPSGNTAGKIVSLSLRNSGGFGVGYSLSGANPMPPSTGGSHTDVQLFVREGMRIEKDLYVVGNSRDGLTTNGNAIGGKIFATGGFVPSDRRWKSDIQPLSDVVQRVLDISGVRYFWREDSPWWHNRKEQLGFIAQEVQRHFPEAVVKDSGGFLHVSYEKLIPVLWQAFKESLNETASLERDMDELERIYCLDHPGEGFCAQGAEGGR